MNPRSSLPSALAHALERPNGARLYRCALQLSPYAALVQHTAYPNENEYNLAIVAACRQRNIEVVAVADNFRIADSWGLTQAAISAGLVVFLGFKILVDPGTIVLCLYDSDQKENLEHHLMELKGYSSNKLIRLLGCVRQQGGIAIPLDGSIHEVWVSTGAVSAPKDLDKPQASCLLKMSQLSVEGLRQALLDPQSRIRRSDVPSKVPQIEFAALAWEGGFFDGEGLRFSSALNVLIGGRGVGKSTIIESLRYVLDLEPLNEGARQTHQRFVRHVLRNGTRVMLMVHIHREGLNEYLIERTVPNPPLIRDRTGQVIDLHPLELLGSIGLFGQHDVAALAHQPGELIRLIRPFVSIDSFAQDRKKTLRLALEKSRLQLLGLHNELQHNEAQLAQLTRLEEIEKQLRTVGLAELLDEKRLLGYEEQILQTLHERIEPLTTALQQLADSLPFDRAFLSSKALSGLPHADLLAEGSQILARLEAQVQQLRTELQTSLETAWAAIKALQSRWNEACRQIDVEYQQRLRQLQHELVDVDQLGELNRQLGKLRLLREQQQKLWRTWESTWTQRQQLLDEYTQLIQNEFHRFEEAAHLITQQLQGRISIQVLRYGNTERLAELLRREIGNEIQPFIKQLIHRDDFDLRQLAQACLKSRQQLIECFGLPETIADQMVEKGLALSLQLEELEIPFGIQLQFNLADQGNLPIWRDFQALSAGQKATAVLLLLLLAGETPLIVDQPEDDLDNRFITEELVPLIRYAKEQRQLLFSTHNANIPVLGDAELVVSLQTQVDEVRQLRGKIDYNSSGSIDQESTRKQIETILEGGRAAFEMRRKKYGFLSDDPHRITGNYT